MAGFKDPGEVDITIPDNPVILHIPNPFKFHMQPLNKVLGKLIKDVGIEGGVAIAAVRRQWVKTVGEAIAVHTYPDTIKGKVLTIIIDTPQWMHHLSFFKGEITDKLKRFDIKDVRFRIGKLPELKSNKSIIIEQDLSESDLRYLDNTVRTIKDSELQEKLRKLISHGLKKGKKGRGLK